MKRTLMYLYHTNDGGGVEVKEAMGIQQILHANSRFKGDRNTVVINWGSSAPKNAEVLKCKIINPPGAISVAVNKRAFLNRVYKSCRTIPFTQHWKKAQGWLDAGSTVYVRKKIKGKEGQGIEIYTKGQLPDAPLYTKAIKADVEYRVHVVDSAAIAVHRKVCIKQDKGEVRNTSNGWYFRKVTVYPQDIVTQAVPAVKAAGLDFAAVDVLWDGEQAWVLEANTAPGIDGMDWTVGQYAAALGALAEKRNNS